MRDSSVQACAEAVGVSAEVLLQDLMAAGLPQRRADESLSDQDKKALLDFLRSTHPPAMASEEDRDSKIEVFY